MIHKKTHILSKYKLYIIDLEHKNYWNIITSKVITSFYHGSHDKWNNKEIALRSNLQFSIKKNWTSYPTA